MFAMGAATRIYVATGATDTRKGFNGLEGLVRERLACDPTSGHSFLFANGRRDRLKLVFFGSGLWVCAKRMEGGRLCWPEAEGGKVLLSRKQFALLMGGIDLAQTRERKWYRRARGGGTIRVTIELINTCDLRTYPWAALLSKKHREQAHTTRYAGALRSPPSRDQCTVASAAGIQRPGARTG
jgi:transposase